ncbi:MAG TPA: hypothetical protein VH280_10180, partial [Verrucomicrobiae bacterium]|nr:hypothetical protein [Verrucomicrobiae bacterium]
GIRLFRREPLNSTGGTCTHVQHTLHRLLRGEIDVAPGKRIRERSPGYSRPEIKPLIAWRAIARI